MNINYTKSMTDALLKCSNYGQAIESYWSGLDTLIACLVKAVTLLLVHVSNE